MLLTLVYCKIHGDVCNCNFVFAGTVHWIVLLTNHCTFARCLIIRVH